MQSNHSTTGNINNGVKQHSKLIPANKIFQSYRKSRNMVIHTPFEKSVYLSNKYKANVYMKREDLQPIRSFKLRGAVTAFRNIDQVSAKRGVVTASAGNHAQGIAYCCNKLKINGTIFMPSITPKLKINSVKHHGGDYLNIRLTGVTFDDAVAEAKKFQETTNAIFIHAFDNIHVIEGQGGLAVEILEDWTSNEPLNYVLTCVGGGGLCSGLGSYFKQMSPEINLVGFQPMGSPSMYNSLKEGRPIVLDTLETFVDGASMKRTGPIPFGILQQLNQEIFLVPEGLVAKTMMEMYDSEAIILEPAGALSVAGLEFVKDRIVGKNVVCILSGSNNDISRLPEVRLRSQIYDCKQAYYIIKTSLQIHVRMLVESIIDPAQEDITLINTAKKFNSSVGQCVIGLSFQLPEHKQAFESRVLANNYKFVELAANDPLLKILL